MRSMIAELPGFFVGNRRCSGWSHLFLPDPPKNSATKTCPKWWAKFFYFLELEVHHPITIQNYQPFPERKNELFERVPVQEPEANVFKGPWDPWDFWGLVTGIALENHSFLLGNDGRNGRFNQSLKLKKIRDVGEIKRRRFAWLWNACLSCFAWFTVSFQESQEQKEPLMAIYGNYCPWRKMPWSVMLDEM